ncbi:MULTISPECIES: MFS transporter [unclassified Beijerinckia]|uniref:MFS transporter n=1 Tax=unclassified Beijerinckia TaxID=2638183 RepID=UPI0008972C43|nr:MULTISPECIES: MFS transporter [unclassified Beijerinckia]MDH7796241.1 DHA1 family tetracycline resistance protein-like MFS transporter [Beijerinckia sp. GAS462]SEC36527.1 MFS transporter, DHA1 family, tetracycline resistance protein [Beijerinckia sp. 28-YEA-48]
MYRLIQRQNFVSSASSLLTDRTAILAVTVFLNVSGFTIINPVVPLLVGRYVPESQLALTVGVIVSVYAACAFLAAPVLGALSDRYGRRPVLLVSLFGSAIGYVVFGIGGALSVLFAGRIIDGLTAGNIGAIYASVADVTPPAERGRVYGMLGAAGGVGFMFGPVVGGLLGEISPTAPLFAAAVLALLNMLWVHVALGETLPAERRAPVLRWRQLNVLSQFSGVLSDRTLRIAFAASFLFYFAATMMQSNISVFMIEVLRFGPLGIGMALFVVGIMDILAQGVLTRRLLPRYGEYRLARAGLMINAAGFLLIGAIVLLPSVFLLILAIVVFTLGDGLFMPAMNGLVANAASDETQGRVQGAYQGQQAIARIFGPLLAAALALNLGTSAPYWAGALIVAAGTVMLTGLRQVGQPR